MFFKEEFNVEEQNNETEKKTKQNVKNTYIKKINSLINLNKYNDKYDLF
jgi:hypothetical protein